MAAQRKIHPANTAKPQPQAAAPKGNPMDNIDKVVSDVDDDDDDDDSADVSAAGAASTGPAPKKRGAPEGKRPTCFVMIEGENVKWHNIEAASHDEAVAAFQAKHPGVKFTVASGDDKHGYRLNKNTNVKALGAVTLKVSRASGNCFIGEYGGWISMLDGQRAVKFTDKNGKVHSYEADTLLAVKAIRLADPNVKVEKPKLKKDEFIPRELIKNLRPDTGELDNLEV
jgi:hypothetical protein